LDLGVSTERIEVHRKLVRDKIPERILTAGDLPQWWPLADDDEYLSALRNKVVEEATEVRDAYPSERVDELADLFEVVTALMNALGVTDAQVREAADRKRSVRGGFAERIWLEQVQLGAPPSK
jgi:predicted house-cleaning noncanonical NTP pyrophosphatase (MazG superfamily)